MEQRSERRINLAGWVLFVVSALFFIAASVRAGDTLGLLGSLFFLIACFVFLLPYALRTRAVKNDWEPAKHLRRLGDLPPGSVGIWDNQVGVAWYGVRIEEIVPLGYEILHETRNPVPSLPFGISGHIDGHVGELRYVVLRKRTGGQP